MQSARLSVSLEVAGYCIDNIFVVNKYGKNSLQHFKKRCMALQVTP